jgi:release factor glutamine methyltransferase
VRDHLLRELSDLYPVEEIQAFHFLLLEHYSGLTRERALAEPTGTLSESELLNIHFAVKELMEHRPIQHILGKAEFFGLTFQVNGDVLIPRPETEELVQCIVHDHKWRSDHFSILDIGTGSGCIAVALAHALPWAEVLACDISESALKMAGVNAKKNDVSVQFHSMDILNERDWPERTFDVIVSNPPYIRESEKKAMSRNVLDWEPYSALFVKDDEPLIYYRAIFEFASLVLNAQGTLYLEINETLGKEMLRLAQRYPFEETELLQDLNGKDRIIKAIRKER